MRYGKQEKTAHPEGSPYLLIYKIAGKLPAPHLEKLSAIL